MSITQLVKKKKGKKRPGYRGPGEYQGGSSGNRGGSKDRGGGPPGGGATSEGSGRDLSPAPASTNREKGIMSQLTGPQGTTGNITNFKDTGPDRSAVSQFSEYGKNVMAQNLASLRPTIGSKLGGFGKSIFGGLLSLINPFLGFAYRGITSSIPGVFDKFKGSNTLEEFRDKLRGYGRTMPVVFNNPNFDQMIIDNEEEDENFVAPENFITPIAKPNITASNQNLMTTGVQSGPYRGMYDYLETYPNNAGLTATSQFDLSPYGRIRDDDMVP